MIQLAFWISCLHSVSLTPFPYQLNSDSSVVVKNESKAPNTGLSHRFECFYSSDSRAVYSITLCADIPDNNDPARINLGREPGHVFIILSKTDTVSKCSVNQVFGFYPRRPASSLIFKRVHGVIFDNQCREYNASVYKKLTVEEFHIVLDKSVMLSKKKYNLNKYNCYDYALEVFNSIPGIEKLPVTHVKFPFILGRGGSPCGLYRDLSRLRQIGSSWAPYIRFGLFESPESCSN